MSIKFVHTNIIAKDWRKLVSFYQDIFECIPVLPERKLSGEWLDKGTSVNDAHLEGIHLSLPGYGNTGPTLEIFQYNEVLEKQSATRSNSQGYGHIAFHVEDVQELFNKVLASGGKSVGEIVQKEVAGVGLLTFAYVTDPEGNIIELQNWSTV